MGHGKVKEEEEEEEEEERGPFVPPWCDWPWLRPVLCIFTGAGGPPKLAARQWRVAWAISIAGFFSYFDWELFPLTLKQIQKAYQVPESRVGTLASVINLGRVGGMVFSVSADTVGRRRMFLLAIFLYTISILASAAQTSLAGFALCQFAARIFLISESNLKDVYVVEEMDSANRGQVMGMIQSISICGGGVCVLMFGFLGQLDQGWRLMYLTGSLQFPLMGWMWKALPESARFRSGGGQEHMELNEFAACPPQEAHAADPPSLHPTHPRSAPVPSSVSWSNWCRELFLRPFRLLFTAYPKRATSCLCVSFISGFAYTPADTFKMKFLQDAHDLSPALVSVCTLVSGFAGLFVFPIMGKFGDSHGRRFLLTSAYVACPLGILIFYCVPGLLFLPFYFIQMMGGLSLMVLASTYYAETFPSSHRATAQGVMSLSYVLGGNTGLACESLLYTAFHSHATSICVVLLPAFIIPCILHYWMPETAGRDLEDIAPELGSSAPEPATTIGCPTRA